MNQNPSQEVLILLFLRWMIVIHTGMTMATEDYSEQHVLMQAWGVGGNGSNNDDDTTTTTTTDWRHMLSVHTVSRPVPGPTECCIQVLYADVNPVDFQKVRQQWRMIRQQHPTNTNNETQKQGNTNSSSGNNNNNNNDNHQKKDPLPLFVPGYSGSGIIVQRGDSDRRRRHSHRVVVNEEEYHDHDDDELAIPAEFAVGTRVVFLLHPAAAGSGAYAEYCVADYRAMAVVPDPSPPVSMMNSTTTTITIIPPQPRITDQMAATVPLAGCTAYEALVKVGLGPNQVIQTSSNGSNITTSSSNNNKVLIVGGAGGVGSWILLLLQAWHNNNNDDGDDDALDVIVTTSSQASRDWCRQLHKNVQCIHHNAILSLGGGPKGSVKYIICLTEPTPPLFKALTEVIAPYGCICLVGSGPALQSLDVSFLFFKSASLQTVTVFSCFRTQLMASVSGLPLPATRMKELLQGLATGRIPRAPLSPLVQGSAASAVLEYDWHNLIQLRRAGPTVMDVVASGHAQGKFSLRMVAATTTENTDDADVTDTKVLI